MMPCRLLDETDGPAVAILNEQACGDVVLVCEHASSLIPRALHGLGLESEVRQSHVAWDPGALDLACSLSQALDAVLIHQRFSRLVYDCNRAPHSPSAVPDQSEVYRIAGNAQVSRESRQARVNEIYLPFRNALAQLLATRKALGRRSVLVTIHSFTPVYFGQARAAEIGCLHDSDSRLADAMLDVAAEGRESFVVRRNEPYGPEDGVTHTLREHGISNGIANVMIEVRNDLLRSPSDLRSAADYLGELIRAGIDRL